MGAEARCVATVGGRKVDGKALLENDALISEADVSKAGKTAGLVDVKVVKFSTTLTAEKYVIPGRNRST